MTACGTWIRMAPGTTALTANSSPSAAGPAPGATAAWTLQRWSQRQYRSAACSSASARPPLLESLPLSCFSWRPLPPWSAASCAPAATCTSATSSGAGLLTKLSTFRWPATLWNPCMTFMENPSETRRTLDIRWLRSTLVCPRSTPWWHRGHTLRTLLLTQVSILELLHHIPPRSTRATEGSVCNGSEFRLAWETVLESLDWPDRSSSIFLYLFPIYFWLFLWSAAWTGWVRLLEWVQEWVPGWTHASHESLRHFTLSLKHNDSPLPLPCHVTELTLVRPEFYCYRPPASSYTPAKPPPEALVLVPVPVGWWTGCFRFCCHRIHFTCLFKTRNP